MKKKILIIGNSARAYALAKKISIDNEVYVAPGNDAMKEFASIIDIREDSVAELLEFVMENDISLTIPFSIKSLTTGIVDVFMKNNQQVFAPNSRIANLVLDKNMLKKLLISGF